MTGRIICLLGKSRAGKDSFASLLAEGTHNVSRPKFSEPMKHCLEYLYDLPPGALEDPEVRGSKVPGLDKTYLDVMVGAYYSWRQTDPYIVLRKVLKHIERLLELGDTVILTDLRSPEEALEIKKLSQRYPLHLAILHRKEAIARPSDESLTENISALMGCARCIQVVDNNLDLEHLQKQANIFKHRIYLNEHTY